MILGVVGEAAARSVVLGAAVWLILKALRTGNPHVLMIVWTVVLVACAATPALAPWLHLNIPVAWLPQHLLQASPTDSLQGVSIAVPIADLASPIVTPSSLTSTPGSPWFADWVGAASLAYLMVAGAMLVRLVIGIVVMWRVTSTARPVEEPWTGGLSVRVSEVVRVPVTFGSVILLPPAGSTWSDETRKAVLLHEGAHLAHGDFYRLLLASSYRAIFWFLPFAWWLHRRLADLAEVISDDAAIAGLNDRRAYADILLRMADRKQGPPSGLSMAQAATVPWRVERILAGHPLPPKPTVTQSLWITAALAPLAILSAGRVIPAPKPMMSATTMTQPAASIGRPADDRPLDRYLGNFQIGVISVLTVSRDDAGLIARLTSEPQIRLSPAGDGSFVSTDGEESLTFATGDGRVTEVTLRRPDALTAHGNRIDSAAAAVIEAHFQQRLAAAPSRFVSQKPMPGSREALRQVIEDLRLGAPDYGRMSPQLADKVRHTLAQWRDALSLSGPPQSLSFGGVGPGGYDVFNATFATGSAEFRIDLSPEGTIDDLTYRPDGDASPGAIVDCAEEPRLAATADRAPIWLSLVNHSGTDLSLFRLDRSGRRMRTGSIEQGASTIVLTDVARPLVIAESSGQCREILSPGQTTRIHIIPPGQANAPVAPGRGTSVVVSEDALRHYIDGVSQGRPDYDQLLPQAAAAMRLVLPRQQAILAKLGLVREVSFLGVTPTGAGLFRVHFANGATEWRIATTGDGKIDAIALLP